jgi:hypothetical protein
LIVRTSGNNFSTPPAPWDKDFPFVKILLCLDYSDFGGNS